LLDVSRITRGTLTLKVQRLELQQIIAKAVELASPLVEQRGHHLEISAPAEPIWVDADEARLAQVFASILVNAVRYTDNGGHISITLQLAESVVSVAIRDDGRGISAELLTQVFDLFVQGYQSTERSAGGLGIGLTLARSLVEKQGGQVVAESPGVGQGSTFTVRLPVTASPDDDQAAVSVRPQYAKVPRPFRILVVDDNEDAAEMLAEVLRAVGHQVATAGDAAEALRIVHGFRPEIAVLDIGLPVMDGYALAARLRAELGSAAPRFIAVTGYGQQHDRERSLRGGFTAHLVKPIDVQQLLDLVASEP
jgi:CheY-like chemotaxis protein/two-component sensor histidine kinase